MKLHFPILLALPVFGQQLSYEVTSVKPNTSGTFGARMMMAPGGRYSASNVAVRTLILQAYGLMDFQLTGGPSWISTDRFDVEGKAESGFTPTREQSQEMLKSLLADRFQLKVRRETKDLPIYTLGLAKGGSKLTLSPDQTPLGPATGPPPPPVGNTMPRGMIRVGPGNVTGTAMSLDMLIRQISAGVGRPVMNKTGLTGLYDIDFHWTPERMPNLPPGLDLPPVDPNGPSIFVALQEQLGLKLDSATGPVETIVIEKIEKPTEN